MGVGIEERKETEKKVGKIEMGGKIRKRELISIVNNDPNINLEPLYDIIDDI